MEKDKALVSAVRLGDEQKVTECLSQGANPNYKLKDGKLPLHILCERHHPNDTCMQIIQQLIACGADTNAATAEGITLLMHAVIHQQYAVVEYLLLQQHPSQDAGQGHGQGQGHGKTQLNIDAVSKEGYSALYCACHDGDLVMAELLVNHGADVTLRDTHRGDTMLMVAAKQGHVRLVEWLLNQGCYAEDTNHDGWTALLMACRKGHFEVAKVLVRQGHANVNRVNNAGWAPLMFAARGGFVQLVEFLLDEGAEIDVADSHGLTPLILASQNGRPQVVQRLLERNASVGSVATSGKTSFQYAEEHGHQDVVVILKMYGAS
eukprot:CAMPEP_0184706206 /NCGR_PEP_ID=MMETSP0313-20130426/36638_1 /TAXON_ID=2792 /ORGANISM="Porphyridium aerugineum, Strain SAG 1380-2" /LENGTH=319 /DNA_ID=CAMNT_0027167753 /DNA_START=93 /DNA_END=1052 /DNA_ORIENTATION=+